MKSLRFVSSLLLVLTLLVAGCDTAEPQVDADPSVTIMNPTAEAVLEGVVDVAVHATDDGEVDRVDYYLDGDLLHSSTRLHYDWDTETVENGRYQLQVRVYDDAGNRGVSESVAITCCNKKSRTLQAGPIWNNQDAKRKCPALCSADDRVWTGHWWTTVPGRMSVCQCTTDCSKL